MLRVLGMLMCWTRRELGIFQKTQGQKHLGRRHQKAHDDFQVIKQDKQIDRQTKPQNKTKPEEGARPEK